MMLAISRIQRIANTGMRTLALASNDNMKLRTTVDFCGQPLRQFKGNGDTWNTRELLIAGSAVAALTAIGGSETLCEVLEQEEKQDGDDDVLVDGNTTSNSVSVYFDTEYETKRILGSGSFGVVMQCVHKETGHVAAVKMVQDIEGNYEEVQREQQALECLERAGGHENIVGYKGSYYHNDFHYIVLEYVPGISLHSFITKHYTLDSTQSLQLVSQLASALQFMHKADVIHGDLKPENVMTLVNCDSKSRKRDWEDIKLKIIDFGSVSRKSQPENFDTTTTTLSGTRCYWSPEVLEYQEMTPAMDMWALGCILYILISGRHPFDLTGRSSEDEILERVKTESLSFLSPVWTNVPIKTKELICGLLEKDPTRRLSADQVLGHQDIQISLDAHRYRQRLRDAAQYSRNLLQNYPVDLIKPPLASESFYTGLTVRREVSDPEELAFDKYRRRLWEFNHEEYGSSRLKKQKVVFEKVNYVYEENKRNQSILRSLQKELRGQRGECRFNRRERGKNMPKKYPIAKQREESEKMWEMKVRYSLEQKENTKRVTVLFSQEGDALMQSSKDEKNDVALKVTTDTNRKTEMSMTAKSREEEIAEVEEKLRAQHLSRTLDADRLFYKRLAERETNTVLEEVLLDEIYDLAADVFDEEEEKNRNKELPPELLEIVEDALHEGSMEEVLVQKYNVDITRRHLQCLLPLVWLNDEVINFYFQMMSDRDEALVKAGILQKRSHFFNSFFYTKVSENGYNFTNVRRWTRKIDLFAMDKIFVPVNVGNMHWCMAAIFMTEKRIQYYDSMHGSGATCIKVLMRYLNDESEHKKKTKFNDQGWELVTTTPDTPLQMNGSDCGVFSCLFADYLSQNLVCFVSKSTSIQTQLTRVRDCLLLPSRCLSSRKTFLFTGIALYSTSPEVIFHLKRNGYR
ncbi:hypothetical protein DD237_005077 [Peronospora effusa]|uniref:Protein kinase domain-containing protein n=1 Tax=Peronospora effusa TaxID=542832 RepID=A0A425CBG6_9STRA|nr:hypothetical protein DD237_005077 [Peronospora effusa]